MDDADTIGDSTSRIVTSYLKANPVTPETLSTLIRYVGHSLAKVRQTSDTQDEPAPRPAVTPSRSIGNDRLVCLECGSHMRVLTGHLKKTHNLTREAYRERYGRARDYPMIAPNYSARRAEIAKEIGLGTRSNRGL